MPVAVKIVETVPLFTFDYADLVRWLPLLYRWVPLWYRIGPLEDRYGPAWRRRLTRKT